MEAIRARHSVRPAEGRTASRCQIALPKHPAGEDLPPQRDVFILMIPTRHRTGKSRSFFATNPDFYRLERYRRLTTTPRKGVPYGG